MILAMDVVNKNARSVCIGAVVGFSIGLGFHAIAGASLRAAGRASLTPKAIMSQAAPAAARLSGVFAAYTGIRGVLHDAAAVSDAVSCALAGGCVVAGATAASPSRIALIQSSVERATRGRLGGALPRHVVIASSFMSGIVTLGGADLLVVKPLGLRW
jgi:hypothetical protein